MARAAAPARATAPPEPLLRRNASRDASPRRELSVVPKRKGAVSLFVIAMMLLFGVLLAITAFQTRLAERQLQLDRVERQVSAERDRYDQLRQARAQLRSPERLAAEALALGMAPGTATEFVDLPPDVVALVAAAAGALDERTARPLTRSLDDFRTVKETLGVGP